MMNKLLKKLRTAQLKYDLYDERTQNWDSGRSVRDYNLSIKWRDKINIIEQQIEILKNKPKTIRKI